MKQIKFVIFSRWNLFTIFILYTSWKYLFFSLIWKKNIFVKCWNFKTDSQLQPNITFFCRTTRELINFKNPQTDLSTVDSFCSEPTFLSQCMMTHLANPRDLLSAKSNINSPNDCEKKVFSIHFYILLCS